LLHCRFSNSSSATAVMHWKIASSLSRGKLPGPLRTFSCSSCSFLSVAVTLLFTNQQKRVYNNYCQSTAWDCINSMEETLTSCCHEMG
jgi:hypothetical protein